MIRAAGIVLWREKRPLQVEVLLIHRPKYDDWTFPKGKLEGEENSIEAACRELIEETGYTPILGQFLETISYEIDEEKKKVKYWMARTESDLQDSFRPNPEVDRIEWLPIKIARHFLTYDEDRELLNEFKRRERHTSALVLLRHAKALKRSDWHTYDLQRPLSAEGERQSKALHKQLAHYRFSGVSTSDAIRCISTVEVFASTLKVPLMISQDINEETFEKNPKKSLEYIRQLLKFEGNQLVCSHNPIIPHLANELGFKKEWDDKSIEPADAIVIHHIGEMVYQIEFLGQPKISS